MGVKGLMYKNPPLPSLFRRIGLSFLLGFSLFVLGAFLQLSLERFDIRGAAAYMDDLIVGVVAGFLVFAYEQRRYRTTLERIRIIAAMNHHVRNALQAITFAPYAEHPKQIELIQDAAHRIQWALDEILPGEMQSRDAPAQGPIQN
jgi:hypothetical protein